MSFFIAGLYSDYVVSVFQNIGYRIWDNIGYIYPGWTGGVIKYYVPITYSLYKNIIIIKCL